MEAKIAASEYLRIRKASEVICQPLETEDYVVQPIVDVSPPKWHLGHTTWFFETFILKPFVPNYKAFHPEFHYIFNSYYETHGARVVRTDRGNLTRPTVSDVYRYRDYVDKAMANLLTDGLPDDALPAFELGLNHEQQHQELLLTDIKYILGNNPLFPVYNPDFTEDSPEPEPQWIQVDEGIYEVGYPGDGFCFDNELGRHKVFLHNFEIASSLVTSADYLEFMENGGYEDFRHWHAEGWDWVNSNKIGAPMYWHLIDGHWFRYGLNGLHPLNLQAPVTHLSFFEASAFASWKGRRLPTEFEWEAASNLFSWGKRWEWTNSAYLPYPNFFKPDGAIGEYNAKFMVSQMVLRGASLATPKGHSRNSYRNFFHPNLRWQFTGLRLAK